MIGSSLQQIGLLYVNLSVYQMLKGSILLFSALLSVLFLDRRLKVHNWIGLFVACAALGIVGFSSVYSSDAQADQGAAVYSISMQLFGIAVIVLGQIVCASQYVVEEHLLNKTTDRASPLVIVGIEGLWGTIVMVAVILPLFQYIPGTDANGVYENTLDSLVKMVNSAWLSVFIFTSFTSVLIYNIVGVMITDESSCIHHTFLDAMRTILIWIVNVAIFYIDPTSNLGEPWTVFSWLQLAGFMLLICGQLIYDEFVKVPGVQYDLDDVIFHEAQRSGAFHSPRSRFISPNSSILRDSVGSGYFGMADQ